MRRASALATALALAACGQSSSTSGDGGANSDASAPAGDGASDGAPAGMDLPLDVLGALCQGTLGATVAKLKSCCSASDQATQDYQFSEGLLAAVAQACDLYIHQSVSDGRASYDMAGGKRCLDAFSAALSSGCGVANGSTMLDLMTSCAGALVGKQGDGQPCRHLYECAPGLACVGFAAASDGTCRKLAAADACGPAPTDGGVDLGSEIVEGVLAAFGSAALCAPGLRCNTDFSGATPKSMCLAYVARGGACTDSTECTPGLACVGGACGDRVPAGSTCSANGDCQAGLFCLAIGQSGECMPKQKAGVACNDSASCLGRCAIPAGATQGTCATFCGSM